MKPARRLRHRIIAGGLALIAAFTGFAAYDGWRLHQQVMAVNERELGNLAKALSGEADRSLQAVDVLLRDTASWYESFPPGADPDAIAAALNSRAVGVQQVSVLTLVDAHGLQRHRSRATGEPMADVSDRPYFLKHRDAEAVGLFINEPIVTRTERVPALVVSRRLSRPDGRFDGVVTAIVTLQALQSAYSAIQLGAGSSLLLALDDGTLVVQQPAGVGPPGTRFPEISALKGGALIDRYSSPVDQRDKLVAVVGVGEQPLLLAISRDEAEALRPWYDEMWSAALRTFMVSVLVGLTISALLRQLGRLAQGERALRQSEERYAMAMEAANEGHAEWNAAKGTLFASEKWNALHGIDGRARPPGAASGLMRDVEVHPDDLPLVTAAFDDNLAGRSASIELEYRVRAADGAWRWIHARGRCLREADGRPLRLFCAATDVTARKEAESDKHRLATRLQQNERLEALGTLAGGIAHDFNNILGAILGFGELAQQQAEAGSALRRHIDRVLQGGARARMLVKRILDFSRSGVAELTPVHVQTVVEEVVAMLTPTLPPGVSLQAELDAKHCAVLGDGTQLYQVVMNLCTNAVQAIDDGGRGTVTVRLQHVEVKEPQLLLHAELAVGAHVRLAIEDSGAGMAPEVLQRMFEPFFTTKKQGEGTGLGLSVVHGIVSDLGGAIDVVSAPGQGTTVSVWLPVSGECEPPAATVAANWPIGQGQTVLIVDDERSLVELAEETLASLGYEPVGFESAEAALQAFRADPARFDALLTDEMLPGMSGSELARTLRALRPDLPVILMSGKVSKALVQRAREAGVGAVLHKPLALRELATRLAEALHPQPGAGYN